MGRAEVQFTATASSVLGDAYAKGKTLPMYFANGLVGKVVGARNGHLEVGPCVW